MGDQIVVLPLDHVALLYFEGHRIKLKIPHRNLSDSRCEDGCNGRCNSIGRSAAIACVARTPRANQECAADDDRKPADAEQPKSQHSATSARLASLAVNRSRHILHILCRRAIHSLAIEVVDHRYEDWRLVGAPSLAADNAIHGAWVEGAPVRDWRGLDLSRHAVNVLVNGQPWRVGSGANVLGNPLNVVAWLANELPRHGRVLRRGEKVSTGTTAEVYFANPGDRVTADFGELGKAEVAFSEE